MTIDDAADDDDDDDSDDGGDFDNVSVFLNLGILDESASCSIHVTFTGQSYSNAFKPGHRPRQAAFAQAGSKEIPPQQSAFA